MRVVVDKDTTIIVNDVDLGEIPIDRNLGNAWIEIKKEILYMKKVGETDIVLGLETALEIINNLILFDKMERIKNGEIGEVNADEDSD